MPFVPLRKTGAHAAAGSVNAGAGPVNAAAGSVKKRASVVALALLVPLTATGCYPAGAGAADARPGADHGNERLLPGLGNGGYDAHSYDVHFDYRAGTTRMRADSVMDAIATQNLSRFSLDSAVKDIEKVTVNDRPARFRTDAKREKLHVVPERPVGDGNAFRVRIRYTADRAKDPVSPAYHLPKGIEWPVKSWINTKDGFAFMGQPDRAHLFFPSNDVPSDKARITFGVTVPRGTKAVANGDLVRHRRLAGSRDEYTYTTRDEIPTHVTQLAVGKFRAVDQRGPHGLPVRSWVPADQYDKTVSNARRTAGQISWLEKALGLRYPFDRYGVLGVDSDYNGVALETATLSTFSAHALTVEPSKLTPIMVHELAHQWFGDAVSVRSWDDMWLSEGHATYYQMLYAASHGGDALDAAMKKEYAGDAEQRSTGGPPARLKKATSLLFNTDAPGALMLYGLRNKVGESTFRKIETTFFRTYQGRSATTQDYIDIANRVSGQDLTPYVKSWLHGKTTPPMPTHPNWKPSNPH
ncbi:M1 family metallopeptidase [Streptomyces sp. NPDC047117]|uniref:M1 family metallopeptidase n=1 Tax=Streptomyces sp. NPDC047117 TaxID=3155379 RepID=UPI0033E09B85